MKFMIGGFSFMSLVFSTSLTLANPAAPASSDTPTQDQQQALSISPDTNNSKPPTDANPDAGMPQADDNNTLGLDESKDDTLTNPQAGSAQIGPAQEK